MNFTCLFSVPGQPGGVKAMLMAPDTAMVTWLPPAHPNGQLTKYSVYVRDLEGGRQVEARNNPVPAPPVESHKALSASTSVLQFRLNGMRKKHRYEFWVTAHTRVGEGQSSAVVAIGPSPNGRSQCCKPKRSRCRAPVDVDVCPQCPRPSCPSAACAW